MIRYYDVGTATASIEKINNVYRLVIIESGMRHEYRFRDELGALREILSYAEVDDDWFNEKAEGAR